MIPENWSLEARCYSSSGGARHRLCAARRGGRGRESPNPFFFTPARCSKSSRVFEHVARDARTSSRHAAGETLRSIACEEAGRSVSGPRYTVEQRGSKRRGRSPVVEKTSSLVILDVIFGRHLVICGLLILCDLSTYPFHLLGLHRSISRVRSLT